MFDPALPAEGSPLESAVMRAQLTGLKALIDVINAINAAQVDGVTTVDPADPATAQVSVIGNTLHFTFAIPRGMTGIQGQPGGDGADGGPGPTGPQGPPFAQAVVDAVNTLNPGEAATVSVTFDGSNVRFTFGIPAGQTGAPGEVTAAQLDTAIAGTAQNPTAVSTLNQTADGSYSPTQMQQVMDKLDEVLMALKRV